MNLRKYLVLLCVVVFGSIGDVLLSRGMKQVGEVHFHEVGRAIMAIGNPWVFVGICCLCLFFASYSTALSWADLTFVLPATAIGYVFLALLSKHYLHEQISHTRWAGIILITLGVGFVAGGPHQTDREQHRPAALVDSHSHQPEVEREA